MRAYAGRRAVPFRAVALAGILATLGPLGSGACAEPVTASSQCDGAATGAASFAALRRAALWLGGLAVQGIADEDERRRDVRRVSGYDAPPVASSFDAASYGRYRDALRADDPYAAPRSLIDLVPRIGDASLGRTDGATR
jgi:hypothetical protein